MRKLRRGYIGLVGAALLVAAPIVEAGPPPGRYPCPPTPRCAPHPEGWGIFVTRVRPWPGADFGDTTAAQSQNGESPAPAINPPDLKQQIESGSGARDVGSGTLPEPSPGGDTTLPGGPSGLPGALPGSPSGLPGGAGGLPGGLPGGTSGLPGGTNGLPGGLPSGAGDLPSGGSPSTPPANLPTPPGIPGALPSTTPSGTSLPGSGLPSSTTPGTLPDAEKKNGTNPAGKDAPALPLPNSQTWYSPQGVNRSARVSSLRDSYRFAESEAAPPTYPVEQASSNEPLATRQQECVESKVVTASGESTIRWVSPRTIAQTASYQSEDDSSDTHQATNWVASGQNPLRARLASAESVRADEPSEKAVGHTSWSTQGSSENPLRFPSDIAR